MFPKQPQRSRPRGIGTRLFHDPKAVDAVLTWPRWNGCRWLHGILIGAAENTLRCSCLKKMFEEDNGSSHLSKGKTDLAVADAWIHIFVSLQDIFFGILDCYVSFCSTRQTCRIFVWDISSLHWHTKQTDHCPEQWKPIDGCFKP